MVNGIIGYYLRGNITCSRYFCAHPKVFQDSSWLLPLPKAEMLQHLKRRTDR